MVTTPAGHNAQGGIDRIMMSLQNELELQPEFKVRATFIATRGRGPVAFSALYVVSFCARMAWAKLRGRLDLVHINLASDGSTYRKLFISGFARLLSVAYVLHLHGAEYMSFWSGRDSFLSRRIKNMFEQASAIVVLGRPWKEFALRRAPGIEGKLHVVANAAAGPRQPHVGGGASVHVIFLGRIGARKGVPQLCDALAAMKGLSGWRATLAGDGDVEWLRSRLDELELSEKVTAPGWQHNEQVANLLTHADILVLPSFAENLPVSVIEGMAEGLAIVATPVGAVEDIIEDGRTGLLVPPGDVEALRKALEKLVREPELRESLGRSARERHRQELDLPAYARNIQCIWLAATDPQPIYGREP
ncbi:glycosyltransferase family 4 protein [Pseudorhizobium pelagicum]|nr:glycosyltransferase family 4 protein [Pseudorhizobium pelagicum]